jgi:mannose-6-phosphate isomerase-like protein (cupin superfamily)
MYTIPRCVVTGHKSGKSAIIKDGLVDNVVEHIPGFTIADVWATNTMPVALEKEVPIHNTLFPNVQSNGSYFRYVCIPPDAELKQCMPELANSSPNNPHPFMHKTATLDYIIILSGELYLILEDGETLLKPGDIVIQQGTNHAWSNRTDKLCIQLAILLDANNESSNKA